LPPAEYGAFAVRAERVGFDTVWLGDHLVTPVEYSSIYPYNDAGRPSYDDRTPIIDVFVLLGHLAALTSTIRLGTGVLILPLRNPFVTARAAASVQDLSSGRLRLGVGTGWMSEEFDAVGERFEGRGRRFDEILAVLSKLWTGDVVEHDGPSYSFAPLRFAPAPSSPIELTFGGTAPRALERAARLGNGWFAPFWPLERAVPLRDQLLDLRRAIAADDRPFACWFRMFDPPERSAVGRYAAAGVDHLVISPTWAAADRTAPLADRLDALDRAAELLDLETPHTHPPKELP
jgi:probable F420-dependent oxidoreductase